MTSSVLSRRLTTLPRPPGMRGKWLIIHVKALTNTTYALGPPVE